ncbi:MAG: hypothetical protein JXR71_06835 [Bacteroidales bacterium]|nr:hypothetical protein [Bacteroidales bacterium]
MKTKTIIFSFILAAIATFTLSSKSNASSPNPVPLTKADNATFYYYITVWSNYGADNNAKGVAYVTNIFPADGDAGNAFIEDQFDKEFEARYGKKKYFNFIVKGRVTVNWETTYGKAHNALIKDIAQYRDDGAKVQFINGFEYYKD